MQADNIVNRFVETDSDNFRVQSRILQDHAHQLTEENENLKARIDQLETLIEEMDKSDDAAGSSSLVKNFMSVLNLNIGNTNKLKNKSKKVEKQENKEHLDMSLVKRQIDGLQRQLSDANAYIVTLQDEIQNLNQEITEMQKTQKLKLANHPNRHNNLSIRQHEIIGPRLSAADGENGINRYRNEQFGGGLAHAFSPRLLSDCLRRGELKYLPNREVRENGSRMHKSYSTRDVFSGDDSRSTSSHQRGGQQPSFVIKFPPTLPRRGDYDMNYRPVSRSRGYADWDDTGRAGFGGGSHGRKHDDEMRRLEREMIDSTLLMPVPNGKLNKRDHRAELIPGGYETYHEENRANSGRRLGRDGNPVDFDYSEASHEYNYIT